jgi:hypothetical protein
MDKGILMTHQPPDIIDELEAMVLSGELAGAQADMVELAIEEIRQLRVEVALRDCGYPP